MAGTQLSSSINFLAHDNLYDGEKPFLLKFDPPSGFPRTNYNIDRKDQLIQDIRGREGEFSIAKNGFSIMPIDTKMAYEDFDDEDKLREVYFPEVAEALQKLLGAFRVQIFEHLVRKRHVTFPIATGEQYSAAQPTTAAHIDMTRQFATVMAEHMNERKGIELPSRRYQFINVWRPLKGPVRDWPLAVGDSSTVDPKNIQAADVVFGDFTTEHHLVQYDPNLKWYFLSNQRPTEAWAFLQADSRPDGLIGAPHSSFAHPDMPANGAPRESIEVRALVYFQE